MSGNQAFGEGDDNQRAYAARVNGVLNWPKLTGFSEILDYKGLTISPPIILSQLTSLTLSISSSSPLAFRALLGGTPVKKADVTLIGHNGVSTTAEWAAVVQAHCTASSITNPPIFSSPSRGRL